MGILRLVLALGVVVGHSAPLFGYVLFDGAASVQCFYVLSGFYMALVLDGSYAAGAAGVAAFYASRYSRLLPTYLVVASMTMVAFALLHRTFDRTFAELAGVAHSTRMTTYAALALSNLLIVGQDWANFAYIDPHDGALHPAAYTEHQPFPAHTFMLVPQAWSLGVELSFYVLAPFVLRRSTRTIAIWACASLALRLVLASQGFSHGVWSYRFFPSEIGVFLLGALAYRAHREGLVASSIPVQRASLLAVLACVAIYHYLPLPILLNRVCMLFVLAAGLPNIFALTRRAGFDTYLGKLSYPIYVAHRVLYGVTKHAVGWRGPATCLLSIASAIALVWLVEDRVEDWRKRFKRA